MKKLQGPLGLMGGLVALGIFAVGLVSLFESIRPGNSPGAQGYPAQATPAGMQGYPPPQTQAAASRTPPSTLPILIDAPLQFEPKTYGIPDVIAGYKVLAIVTAENTACLRPGEKILVLQSTAATVDEFLKSAPAETLTQGMDQAGMKSAEWEISIAGPQTTLDSLVANTQASNREVMKTGDCGPTTTGGPVRATPGTRNTPTRKP